VNQHEEDKYNHKNTPGLGPEAIQEREVNALDKLKGTPFLNMVRVGETKLRVKGGTNWTQGIRIVSSQNSVLTRDIQTSLPKEKGNMQAISLPTINSPTRTEEDEKWYKHVQTSRKLKVHLINYHEKFIAMKRRWGQSALIDSMEARAQSFTISAHGGIPDREITSEVSFSRGRSQLLFRAQLASLALLAHVQHD
jgi:hypothetical protein